MAQFTGQLKTNKMFAALYNMIISQQVFGTGVSDLSGIYDSRKLDGTLYGDTKLFISTDALKSYAWDGTDTPGGYNLLTTHTPPAPATDAITIDVFRQIPVTTSDYLVKQAFMGEGQFSDFNGTILSWLQKTKEVYEHTTYTYSIIKAAGTGSKALGTINLVAPTGISGYDLIKWRAQELFRQLDDYTNELKEPSRDYNDLGFLRNYSLDDFDIVVPLGVLSDVNKHDIPFLYNEDRKVNVKEVHWKYFVSAMKTSAGTSTGAERSAIEGDFTKSGSPTLHLFPGDLIPKDYAYPANGAYTPKYSSRPSLATAIDIYLIHKKDFPIMSAFATGTSFFNARRLDLNSYLTFGHNNVESAHLRELALLKLSTTVAED